jgi:hypothetical protein
LGNAVPGGTGDSVPGGDAVCEADGVEGDQGDVVAVAEDVGAEFCDTAERPHATTTNKIATTVEGRTNRPRRDARELALTTLPTESCIAGLSNASAISARKCGERSD